MGKCAWISTEPPDFDNACGAPTHGAYPYCLAHCHRAYAAFAGPPAEKPAADAMPWYETAAKQKRRDPRGFVYGSGKPIIDRKGD